jgi:hypothetical protein
MAEFCKIIFHFISRCCLLYELAWVFLAPLEEVFFFKGCGWVSAPLLGWVYVYEKWSGKNCLDFTFLAPDRVLLLSRSGERDRTAATRRCRWGAARTLKKNLKRRIGCIVSLAYFILFKKHYLLPCTSVGDPDPDPQDPHVIGPAGSGSIIQMYGYVSVSCSESGSGSFVLLIKVLSGLK